VKRPLEDGRVHHCFDRFRSFALRASADEEHERKVGPRRLVRNRLAETRLIDSEQRVVGDDGAGCIPISQRLQQELAGAVDERLDLGAGQELADDLGIAPGGRHDQETIRR